MVRRVSFISVEETDKDSLIAFALEHEDDPIEIETLTLMRTPLYERFLYRQERGVTVTLEGESMPDEENCLTACRFSAGLVKIETRQGRTYQLDTSRVDPDEMDEMKRLLKRMNFDSSFALIGL